eukprot:276442_1
MWACPYNHLRLSNWCGIGIDGYNSPCKQAADELYYFNNNPTYIKRAQRKGGEGSIEIEYDNIRVRVNMTSGHHAKMNIDFLKPMAAEQSEKQLKMELSIIEKLTALGYKKRTNSYCNAKCT